MSDVPISNKRKSDPLGQLIEVHAPKIVLHFSQSTWMRLYLQIRAYARRLHLRQEWAHVPAPPLC
jgi:hypothetical protein